LALHVRRRGALLAVFGFNVNEIFDEGMSAMILGLPALTFAHVLISLTGIVSGFIVLFGLIAVKPMPGWTALFLLTTVATSVTGFVFFPFHHFMPSHGVGIISLLVLSVVLFARYVRRLVDAWRWIYVIGAVLALYLNVFVLIVQSFQKVPALHALAPQQTEPPFLYAQLAVLGLFVVLGLIAVVRFRPAAGWTV
jgi:hypothetical protein